jgi:hypothetical protein
VSEIIKPGAALLFMKVGAHARENLDDIFERKAKEIEDTGFAMWGYGGNTCHPRTMVQPFAEEFAPRGPIYLCMQEMQSSHWAEPLRAHEYSPDGIDWRKIPDTINVKGSRFALVIKNLRREKLTLPLARTQVAVGNSRGKLGSRYVQGRVDKACLQVMPQPQLVNDQRGIETDIDLIAELAEPFAVFLRDPR